MSVVNLSFLSDISKPIPPHLHFSVMCAFRNLAFNLCRLVCCVVAPFRLRLSSLYLRSLASRSALCLRLHLPSPVSMHTINQSHTFVGSSWTVCVPLVFEAVENSPPSAPRCCSVETMVPNLPSSFYLLQLDRGPPGDAPRSTPLRSRLPTERNTKRRRPLASARGSTNVLRPPPMAARMAYDR